MVVDEVLSDEEENIPKKKKKVAVTVQELLNELFHLTEGRDIPPTLNVSADDDDGVAGKILSIKLQNFMCHSNLEFNFGDKINFISGKNGSGKSAILTALVMGLGGRTSDTNRGQSVKNLVQNGKNRAVIEITLSNIGPTRFKPHHYGRSIKVVRTISGSSSQYKIISERGEVVSTKRDEIDLINLYFNIQVNNPVAILNQDTARTFIKSAAPKELYHIFMKGTHLEEIEENLASLRNEKIPALEKLISEKSTALLEAYKDVEEYKKKRAKIEKLLELKNKVDQFQIELNWAYVYNIEEKIQAQEKVFSECESKLPQIREKVDKRGQLEQELKEKLKNHEKTLKELKSKARETDSEVLELERSVRNAKEKASNKVSEIKRCQKKVESEQKNHDDLKMEIDQHEIRSQELGAKRAQMETQRQELETRLSELRAVKSTTQVHRQQLIDTKDAIASTLQQKEQFYHNMRQKLGFKEEELRRMKTEKSELAVYSRWMPELVDQIEKAHRTGRFKEKPRGPLGAYIQLKEKAWGPAIESVIGAKTLNSFCVDNQNDYKMLKAIIERMNIPAKFEPSLTISKFFNKVHDVRKNETGDGRYKSLLRYLTIKDPVITNCLIDSMEAESILLIPTNDEAYSLMEDINNVPPNCKKGITLTGDLFFPSPNYRSYSGQIAAETRYLQVSQEQAVKHIEQEIRGVKDELSRLQADVSRTKQEVDISIQNLDQATRDMDKISKQIVLCEKKIEDIKTNMPPETYDIQLLKEDLEYRKKNVETYLDTIKVLEAEKDNLVEQYREQKENLEKQNALREKQVSEINAIEAELSELEGENHRININRDHYVNLLKNEEAKLASIRDVIAKLDIERVKNEKCAKELHPERVEQKRDIAKLENEVKRLQGEIKVLEKAIGNNNKRPEQFEQRLNEVKEKHEILEHLKATVKTLGEVYTISEEKCRQVKELVTLSTKHSFTSMLRKKKFMGDLIIDHERKSLKVVIKVESTANEISSTLTLSGGERSYSMVSFIMALWDNMYSPFFFLDEFDVFMDEINRNIIMTMLLEYAKRKPEQQFVFLTPHGNLPNELLTNVQFFRMNDPRD